MVIPTCKKTPTRADAPQKMSLPHGSCCVLGRLLLHVHGIPVTAPSSSCCLFGVVSVARFLLPRLLVPVSWGRPRLALTSSQLSVALSSSASSFSPLGFYLARISRSLQGSHHDGEPLTFTRNIHGVGVPSWGPYTIRGILLLADLYWGFPVFVNPHIVSPSPGLPLPPQFTVQHMRA